MTLDDPESKSGFQWAITSGNVGGAFSIAPATGDITLAQPIANHELMPVYNLDVKVTDVGGLSSASVSPHADC